MIFLFLEPKPTESPFGRCPEGFDDFGHEEFCYTVQGTDSLDIDWMAANFNCLGLGGHLVSVHSEHENSIVHKATENTGSNVWIGLIRSGSDSGIFTLYHPNSKYLLKLAKLSL
jgi:hypothetical protein